MHLLRRHTIAFSLPLSMLLLGTSPIHAASGDMAIYSSNVSFSNEFFIEGQNIRIWASALNQSGEDLLGTVQFSNQNGSIGSDQPVSILAGSTDAVFIDWTPPNPGAYTIYVKVLPWEPELDNPGNNLAAKEIFVEADLDRDGIQDSRDPDIDGDGCKNEEDEFPKYAAECVDTDGDGTGNNEDDNDDNDECLDEDDKFPLDPLYCKDGDEDGIPDKTDTDLDNDKLQNEEEAVLGTDPTSPDTDRDGILDGDDPFPLDPNEWADGDGDGIGNNSDPDLDNDGLKNEVDPAPENAAPKASLIDYKRTTNLMTSVFFDASPSLDPDGDKLDFSWEIEGKRIGGQSLEHQFTSAGSKTAKLTVTDAFGQSDSIDFEVKVLNIQNLVILALSALSAISLALLGFYRYNRAAFKKIT